MTSKNIIRRYTIELIHADGRRGLCGWNSIYEIFCFFFCILFKSNQIHTAIYFKFSFGTRRTMTHENLFEFIMWKKKFFFSFLCNPILIQQVVLWSFSELLLIRDDKVEMNHKKRMGWEKRTYQNVLFSVIFIWKWEKVNVWIRG